MRRLFTIHHPQHKTPMLIGALLALLMPLALSGPAVAKVGQSLQHANQESHQSENDGPQTWTVLAGSQSRDLAIQGMSFLPSNIFVNAGDTVTWLANSAEPHTVTFLAVGQSLPQFNPGNPLQTFAAGGSSYDGMSYYNSGILTTAATSGFPAVHSYSLKFPDEGNFSYYCLLHGVMTKGTVHVAEAGTEYPYAQEDYGEQAQAAARAILRDGRALWHETAELADAHHVYTGADDGTAMVMRFIQPTVRVRVGQSVTFLNKGMGAPHTVTFGTEPANFFAPLGNPATFAGGDLNSGFMLPGSSFTVTFTKAGTFKYLCALHDFMGMVGTVVVK